ETGKFKDHPRTFVHFAQVERQLVAHGRYPDLGTALDSGLAIILVPLAITFEHDRVRGGACGNFLPLARIVNAQAAHVSFANGRIPACPDDTSVFGRGDAVIDDDIGARLTTDRAVHVLECRTPVSSL